MTLVRALAGLVLGLVVFAGLLYFLVVVNFSQRLEDPEVYNLAISDTDAYNRIYDEVLVDEALEEQAEDLLGGLDVSGTEESIDLLRDVMPPAYLQDQTEANIERFTGFLRNERKNLQIYVELEEPLERIGPAVQGKVHGIIDGLTIEEPQSSGCSLNSLQQLAGASAEPYAQLSDGELPDSSPSLKILDRGCREREYDQWFDLVLNDPLMNSEAARILEGRKEELRPLFVDGDTRAFLKAIADALVEPLVEDAVSDVRRELQRGDRFDVLDWISEQSDDLRRRDIDDQAETLRSVVSAANGSGKIVALLLIVVGTLLLAAVHLPKPGDVLRWPGITLLLGAGVCLVVGIAINSAIPGQINEAVTHSATYSDEVPAAAVNLVGDLLESFGRQATAGFMPGATTVMVLGGLLVAASFFAGALTAVLKRLLPGSGGSDRSR